MRRLGLIGGTSWHSTAEYYRNINQLINDHFGDNTNPPLLLYNLNQSLIHKHQVDGDWSKVAELLIDAGLRLEAGGSEAIMLCANTPHKVFEIVEQQLHVPIIHIADATAADIKAQDLKKVCFLGTKFSMQQEFITGRIAQSGIDVLVPNSIEEIEELHRIIQKELTFGKIIPSSKQYVFDAIESMTDRGAKGVILGCTEFPLMVKSDDLLIPIFNTTEIHSRAAVNFILAET